MKTLELRTADGRFVAGHVHMACSFRSRCIGLLRQSNISEQAGLLLVPGRSIHTLGMRFTIDVVFLSRQMRVLALVERVPPWRVVIAPRGTARVLELAAGRIAVTGLTTGTYLTVDSAVPESNVASSSMSNAACERAPIQFSLRLPVERRCTSSLEAKCSAGDNSLRTPLPYRRALGCRAEMTPSVGN